MAHKTLAGRVILIAEDEAVISMEIENTFKAAGARVRISGTVEDAMVVAEDADLAAAVVNHFLWDGESSPVCQRLKERDIPFRALQWLHKCPGGLSHWRPSSQACNQCNSARHCRGPASTPSQPRSEIKNRVTSLRNALNVIASIGENVLML